MSPYDASDAWRCDGLVGVPGHTLHKRKNRCLSLDLPAFRSAAAGLTARQLRVNRQHARRRPSCKLFFSPWPSLPPVPPPSFHAEATCLHGPWTCPWGGGPRARGSRLGSPASPPNRWIACSASASRLEVTTSFLPPPFPPHTDRHRRTTETTLRADNSSREETRAPGHPVVGPRVPPTNRSSNSQQLLPGLLGCHGAARAHERERAPAPRQQWLPPHREDQPGPAGPARVPAQRH